MKAPDINFDRRKLAWTNESELRTQKLKTPSSQLEYWRSYFNITYFLGITPFCLNWNKFSQQWELKRSTQRKIISSIVSLAAVSFMIRAYLSISMHMDSRNPLIYFELSTIFSTLFYAGSFLLIVWTKQNLFLQIFKSVQSRGEKTRVLENTTGKLNYLNLLKIYYVALITTQTFLPDFTDPDLLTEFYAKRARALRLDKLSPSAEMPFGLIIFAYVMDTLGRTALTFVDLMFASTVLFFRVLVKDFVRDLTNESVTSPEVIEHYKTLKANVALINKAIQTATFAIAIGALPFYCEILSELAYFEWPAKIRMFIYIVNLVTHIILASISHQEIGQIYDWLHAKEKYKEIPHPDLHLLLYDISLNDIGITSAGRPLSFKLLGSLLGLTITYVIIRYQFKTEERGRSLQQ